MNLTNKKVNKDMNSKQRVMKALKLEKPDRVPFMELQVDSGFVADLIRNTSGQKSQTQSVFNDHPVLSVPTIGSTFEVSDEVAGILELDAVGITFWIKHLGLSEEIGGRQIFRGGSISSLEDVESIRFPDPYDIELYAPLYRFLEQYGNSEKAIYCVSNLGSDPVILGLGFENFAMSIYTQPEMVVEMLRRYSEWQAEVFKVLSKMDFDFLWTTDDIAFKTSTYISPGEINEFLMPGYRKVAKQITKPWIYHSDGDLNNILDDLLTLGMNGIHPVEPGPMILNDLIQKYGNDTCFVGHIDINVLSEGTPQEARYLVKNAIESVHGRPGYICGSSNSITDYCKVENVIAMGNAIKEFGSNQDKNSNIEE
jgi:uroporphyrinogen decarboxylase